MCFLRSVERVKSQAYTIKNAEYIGIRRCACKSKLQHVEPRTHTARIVVARHPLSTEHVLLEHR